ncbi:D-alanyl-D-alanine carboxypeptidase DacF precursor [compost metagenome]
MLLKKGEANQDLRHELQLDAGLKAPIAAGTPIGKIIVFRGDQKLTEFPVEAPMDIPEAGFWDMLKRTTSKIFFLD